MERNVETWYGLGLMIGRIIFLQVLKLAGQYLSEIEQDDLRRSTTTNDNNKDACMAATVAVVVRRTMKRDGLFGANMIDGDSVPQTQGSVV